MSTTPSLSGSKGFTLKAVLHGGRNTSYYAVSFYPYSSPDDEPILAVCGGVELFIARSHPDNGLEIIQYYIDENSEEDLCTLCWCKDPGTGSALVASGGEAHNIKVLDAVTGKLKTTLTGHGDNILDVQTCPTNPGIIASASQDHTIRIWSLDDAHKNQPCALICGGEGHRETVLSIAWHPTGRFILSGGMDHVINLWTIPVLPDSKTGTDKPSMVYFPHFSSITVHSNYVDCLCFVGDLILSKAAKEHKIVLWQITNFDSTVAPPPAESAPTTHEWRETRSAFGEGFERLLQFSSIDTDPFFLKFGLCNIPNLSSMLAMGSTGGKIYLWDLHRITQLEPKAEELDVSEIFRDFERERTVTDEVSDPFGRLKPHITLDIPKIKTAIRQCTWSLDGNYLAAVGDFGMAAVFKRNKQ